MLRNTLNTFITATLIMLLGLSSSAQAVLPSGNLMGTTTVTFGEDVQDPPSKTEVIVTLVPSAPSVSIVRDAMEALEPGTAVELTVTITSTANGLDNYVVTAKTVPTDGLVSVGQFTLSELVGPIPLGATAAISIEGRIITVLYDGEADNGNVNGIEAGDTVIIGDNEYEYKVASISDKEESSTITLTDAGEDPSIELGTHIVERKTETVEIPSIATLGPDAALDQQVTYSVNARTSETGLEEPDETLIVKVLEALRPPAYDKWVRNVVPERNPDEDGAADNLEGQWGVTDAEILAKDWHQAGVTALPDDILEYLVVVRAGNWVDLEDWSVEESPPDFTEIVDESVRSMKTTASGVVIRVKPQQFHTRIWKASHRSRGSLARNDTFYFTYQVTVIGGAGEVEPVDSAGAGEDKEAGASAAGGESIYDTFPYGTPWRTVVDAGAQENPELQACWCKGAGDPNTGYCDEEGWTVGPNQMAVQYQAALRDGATEDYASGVSSFRGQEKRLCR